MMKNLKKSMVLLGIFSTCLVQAKTLTCPVGILRATSDIENGKKAGYAKLLKVDVNADVSKNFGYKFKTDIGETVEVAAIADEDSKLKGLYSLEMSLTVNGKRDGGMATLLREVESKPSWNMGPEGSIQVHMLQPDSLSEKYLDIRLTSSAFEVLKKHGQKNRAESSNTVSVLNAAKEAVLAGELKEGQALGLILGFGCYIPK
jgi:hypothetical protein